MSKPVLFFCAIGGSGMMPLALMMKAQGWDVCGSDRGRDHGRAPERFAFLEEQGIVLFPQDGSGITQDVGQLIVSSAVEENVPDYQEALKRKIPIKKRADLLAGMFNAAKTRIAVAGTSGKSTTTGMIGLILHAVGQNPTIVNGAVMKNFVSKAIPFASAVCGKNDFFVAEVDESDGSIALFNPTIAVLNNISLDHKSIEELRELFSAFVDKAQKVVINIDNDETRKIASSLPDIITYSLTNRDATLWAFDIFHHREGSNFNVRYAPTKESCAVKLKLGGNHNVSNALAALGAALAAGAPFLQAAQALNNFEGIARRFDVVGTSCGVTVIDDFAHNPDKIAATLATLKQFSGRLLILFQPHGYGPLLLMKESLAVCFATHLGEGDELYISDPLYLGGTTDRSVTSEDLVRSIVEKGGRAQYLGNRKDCSAAILLKARAGDRIVVMGARDDTLPALAKSILEGLLIS